MLPGSTNHILTAQDLAVARRSLETLSNPVVIKVIQTRNPLSERFRRFIDQLVSVSDKLKPLYLTYTEDGPPRIELQPNLSYLALPWGRELSPFLQTLILSSKGKTSLTARSLSALEDFITPTKVEVLMSPACPNCPMVVGLVNQVALANNYLEVSVIDVAQFTDYADRYGIRAVPTVLIGGEDQLVGNTSEEVLVDRLTNRVSSAYHPETFKRIVKEGDAKRLAGMMVADGDLYSGALDLLADPDWSVRMGMMVVLEEVAECSSNLVQQSYPHLLELLDHEEANLRGDAAYLLGHIGDASILGSLESLVADVNPEVAEAAQEAIQQIRERKNKEG